MDELEGITPGPTSEDIREDDDDEYCLRCGEIWVYCSCYDYNHYYSVANWSQ